LPALHLPPQAADEDTPLLINPQDSSPVHDGASQSNAIEFLVSMETDWKAFVLRIIGVALASVVFVSTFVERIPLHILLTGPIAVFAVAVVIFASSNMRVLTFLLRTSLILLIINILALLFAQNYTLLLWDSASVFLLVLSSFTIRDLISTHFQLITKYTHEYQEAARTSSSHIYHPTMETANPNYYNHRLSLSSTDNEVTPRWLNARKERESLSYDADLDKYQDDPYYQSEMYNARDVSAEVSYDTDSPSNKISPKMLHVYLPSEKIATYHDSHPLP
jgi:hypothetical protein